MRMLLSLLPRGSVPLNNVGESALLGLMCYATAAACLVGMPAKSSKLGQRENTEFPCASAFPINHLKPALPFSPSIHSWPGRQPLAKQLPNICHGPLAPLPLPQKQDTLYSQSGRVPSTGCPCLPKGLRAVSEKEGHTPHPAPHHLHPLKLREFREPQGLS